MHFNPNADAIPLVSIGPTATPAWGAKTAAACRQYSRR